jgi:hypothetical protein
MMRFPFKISAGGWVYRSVVVFPSMLEVLRSIFSTHSGGKDLRKDISL